jgi:hypothetical protein
MPRISTNKRDAARGRAGIIYKMGDGYIPPISRALYLVRLMEFDKNEP